MDGKQSSMTRGRVLRSALVICVLALCMAGYAFAERERAAMAEQASDSAEAASASQVAHGPLFDTEKYPSAQACKTCHPGQYDEWSVSQHAYAQLSPVFNAMQGEINKRTNGTFGDFCIRCHTPVGMATGEPILTANENRSAVSQEGITCIACHRVSQPVGKVSGRRPIVTGDLTTPVMGPTGGEEVQRVIDDPEFKVTTEKEGVGRPIHTDAKRFFQLTESGFCGSCHDVTLPNGFRLEEAFSEYKTSPAAARGESCQDCHMGKVPGVPGEYHHGSAANVGGVLTRERRLTNHMFVGPDYPIVHPGLFPHNPEAKAFASFSEWTAFDWEAGWGTDEFEDTVTDEMEFPPRWESVDDRYEARSILERNFKLLERAKQDRHAILREGYKLSEIELEQASLDDGISFKLQVSNGTDGHNVPTGFTAERLVWLQVSVIDASGNVVFKSGDLDPNGDVRDNHSVYVHGGELPLDDQLFSLQSKFITTNVRGGEREQVLAVNYSLDALPFLRPELLSNVLIGRPVGARIHKIGIKPGGSRWAEYEVDAERLRGPGRYYVSAKLIAAMVPVNLVNEIKGVGFDYGMTPRQVADAIVDGHMTLWERTAEFEVK